MLVFLRKVCFYILMSSFLLIISPSVTYAQNPQVDANDQFAFDQVGASLTEVQSFAFKFYLDGSASGLTLAVVVCSGSTSPFQCVFVTPSMSTGTHTLQLTATNSVGESPKSLPFVLDFVTVPNPPSTIRVIRR